MQVLATYHVAATTVLIVDSVAWLVLMPMLSQQHPSPDAAWRKLFFCWTGYNQVFASPALAAVRRPLACVLFTYEIASIAAHVPHDHRLASDCISQNALTPLRCLVHSMASMR
jgi:hypothetical protein